MGEKSSHLKKLWGCVFSKKWYNKSKYQYFYQGENGKIPVKEKNGANYDVRRGKEKM